jgi:exonuclease SbcC
MIPLKLTIEGIGPHSSTEIDFAQLKSPIAILAPYGTGKTTLLESLFICLYGEGAWYSKSHYELMTQGGTGIASITLEFEHGGIIYRAERKMRATAAQPTQTTCLYINGQKDPIAGPKLGSYKQKIESMIGDRDTALASWFLSQNRLNDLCGQPGEDGLVARRRAAFNSLIGAEHLDGIEQRLAEAMRAKEAVALDLEAQLAGEMDPEEAIFVERGGCACLLEQLNELRVELAKSEQDLEAARCRLRDAQGGDDVLKAQIEAHAQAASAASEAEARVNALQRECSALEARAKGLEQAKADAEALDGLHVERIELRAKLEKFEAFAAWDRKRGELHAAAQAAVRRVSDLEAVPGVDETTRELAGRVEELLEWGKAAKKLNDEHEENNRQQTEYINELKRAKAVHEDNLRSAESELATKPTVLFGEKCNPCELMKKWSEIPERIKKIRLKLGDINTAIAAGPDLLPIEDLSRLREEYARAEAAKKAVDGAAETHRALVQARVDAELAQRAVDEHCRFDSPFADDRPQAVADPRPDLARVQADLDRLAGAPERVRACEQAALDLKVKEHDYKFASDALFDSVERKSATKYAADNARAALTDSEAQRASLREAVDGLTKSVATAREGIEQLTGAIARGESRIEDLERRAGEIAAKRQRVKGLREDIDGLRDLRSCFGARGVRQILIDHAAPELEAIADGLFEQATGGRMRLRLATQSVCRDGSTAEDFQILVRDERGERDCTRFSGGQLQLIQILFRIAVALWVGRLRGHKPDCLILDEAFDKLGSEGTEDLLRVLESLQGQVSQIIVVTHDPLIAERMASQVRLSRSFSGVSVEMSGVA